MAWKFENDGMAPGGELEGSGCVSVELVVDKDLGAIRFRREFDGADAFGSRRGLREIGRSRGLARNGQVCNSRRSVACHRHVRIEAMEDVEDVRRAKSKADAADVFLDELLRVDAYDFAVRIQERPAAVAGIDGGHRSESRCRDRR